MVRALIQKVWRNGRGDASRDHVSIIIPFLIISAGLGVLAWRSYDLSIQAEQSANTLAAQYAGYVAEITARRVDAAVRAEQTKASEEWQQAERRTESPNFALLQEWLGNHAWIVDAMYVPDYDPISSIYVSEITSKEQKSRARLKAEFFTTSGTIRYTYDPARLLSEVQSTVRPIRTKGMQQRAEVSLARDVGAPLLTRTSDGFSSVSPLSPPVEKYGIRATVRTAGSGSMWHNHRVISLSASLLALALTSLGAYLAIRGLRKESETMKLRGALIANVSHELRTPLSMIRLGAETLKRGSKLKEKERQDIEDQILREVLHLSHLVENVLDVARIQHQNTRALAFTPVFPRDLITTLVTTYESWFRSKGFTVTVTIDESIGEQYWDREAVSRALLNLIDNAIKYSSDTKVIEITLRQTEQDVVLEVTDHGIGIESKDLAKIFDPYYRAQFSDTQTRRGAGLGLTLVQQIVASHGGRVEVESRPGQGSTFRLMFPRASSDSPAVVPRFVHAPEAF